MIAPSVTGTTIDGQRVLAGRHGCGEGAGSRGGNLSMPAVCSSVPPQTSAASGAEQSRALGTGPAQRWWGTRGSRLLPVPAAHRFVPAPVLPSTRQTQTRLLPVAHSSQNSAKPQRLTHPRKERSLHGGGGLPGSAAANELLSALPVLIR